MYPVKPGEKIDRTLTKHRLWQFVKGELQLGGIAPGSLTAFDRGSIFTPVGTSGGGAEVRLLSRRGLLAEVQLSRSLTPGTLLQETARVIPRDFKLRLGLDPSLGNEANSARQALSSLPRVEPVAFQGGNAPYSREIQYIFSRLTPQYRQSFQQQEVKNLPPTDSLGLLSQSLDEILPDSFGDAGETVAAAITRLAPKLTALVAARLLKLTLNTRSSRLSVEASLQLENQASQLIAQAFTVRGSHSPSQPTARLARQLPINVPFQFRVVNREPTALYLSILVIDSTGDITVLFPNQYGAGEESARIEGNRTLLIPNPAQDNFQFATESKGVGEALIIVSRSPLRKALLALKNLAVEQESPQRGALVTPSVEAISDLLTDLSRTRSGGSQISASPQLNVSEIAALSITFEVI